MSQENVDLITAALREFQEQPTLRALDYTEPDAVWDMSAVEGWPDAVEYIGREGFDDFLIKWTAAYDEFEQSFEDVIDGGDEHVISIIRQRGRPRGSQSWVDLRFAVVWTVVEGKLKRGRVFLTFEEALEAVGPRT